MCCICTYPNRIRHKLQPKSKKCIIIGYIEATKGYRLYNPTTHKIVLSRDVIFNEELQSQTTVGENSMNGPKEAVEAPTSVGVNPMNDQGVDPFLFESDMDLPYRVVAPRVGPVLQ